ncbi:MAG: phage holin family protein [Gammaproteobacteria bacterium]|nr:phage holin family protein [Gammaproteobacteria bacterium]
MAGFLIRCLVSALGLWLASLLISGIGISSTGVLLAAGLLLGIVNAFIRPVMIILTLPFTIITLGLFLFVINAMMLGLVAWFLDGFAISGFWAALGGSIIISLTSWVASWYIGPKGKVELVVVRRD